MDIFTKVDQYISQMLAPEDNILQQTIASLDANGLPQHSVSPNQGKFLQTMVMACQAKRILELGTLGGYSTIWLARSLPEDGHLITIEADAKHVAVAQNNIEAAGLAQKVTLRVGKALDILNQMQNNSEPPFDLIFVDADKPPYAQYLEYALSLSRKGSILIFDNVIREGKILESNTLDEKVLGVQLFNQQLAKCNLVTATILQTVGQKEHDGMAIAVVK